MESTIMLRAALAAAGACTYTAMAAQAPTTPAQTTNVAALEEVVITGSRVIANGNDAPTPVMVMTPEQVLATKPTTLFENLVDLPAFSGSRGVSNGPVGNGPTSAGNVSSLNLRNMGSQRNLVLFDGHRVPPATADGNVDVNALPQMLIQRVDVVTGGASAVYGSDAITGVTNFITDAKFNGIKINLQGGISSQSDDKSYEVGLAFGRELLEGRGHFEASYQHHDDDGVMDVDRDWTKPRWTVQGNGTTIPWHLQDNVQNGTASWGGVITCPNGSPNPASQTGCATRPLVGQSFNQNGVLSPYNLGLTGTANGLANTSLQIGGDGVYFTNVNLKSKQQMDQGFARFDYDLTDDVHAYIAGSWTANAVVGNAGVQRIFPPGYVLGACNPYLSAQNQNTLGCTAATSGTANEATFVFNKAYDPALNFGFGQNNELRTHNYFVMGNLDGKFGDGYRWDATYTHSESTVNVRALNQNLNNIYAAIDAVRDSSGNIVCRVTLTNASQYPGCVPVNLFGPTSMTKEALGYMFKQIQNTTTNKLDGLAGSLTGSPINGWAGPIDMALSGELRKQRLDLTSTSLPTDYLDCAGMRFGNCKPIGGPVTPTVRQVNSWLPISGVNQTIAEGAFEFNLPLISDHALLKGVNLNGAVRYAQYKNDPNDTTIASRTFNATTWKAGIVWDVTDQLTLRWARSQDIRAPSLYDLYLPYTVGSPTFAQDWLNGGQQVSVVPISGGNPYLDPETALTSTVGIVYRPTPQFSLTLDAYSITLKDALYSLNGATQAVQQVCINSGGSSPLCQLQERQTTATLPNQLVKTYSRQVNIAEQKTSGIDLEANFKTHLLERALSLRALLTYQPHILYTIPFALVTYDSAGVAYPTVGSGQPAPVWKGALFVHYQLTKQWTVDLSERYRSKLHWTADPSQTQVGGVSSAAYTNLSVSCDVPLSSRQLSVFLNVQNVFDKQPDPAGQPGNTFPGSYPNGFVVGDDIVGRYYVLGARIRL